MTSPRPKDPAFARRVRDSFDRQAAMRLIGCEMTAIEPGFCRLELPFRPDLTQQHGFFHGGITGMIADSAAGYAAFSLFPADATVLTVEYKLNFLSPGQGERLVAEARVVKPGRTLCIVDMEVFAVRSGQRHLIARGLETLMCFENRADSAAGFKKD